VNTVFIAIIIEAGIVAIRSIADPLRFCTREPMPKKLLLCLAVAKPNPDTATDILFGVL
jgi:hypothetical protein